LILGVVPNTVAVPRGATRVMLSPTRKPSCWRRRAPIITPCPVSNPSRLPSFTFSAIVGSLRSSLARTPLTRTPPALNGEDASACPSTSGTARVTAGTREMRCVSASKSVNGVSTGDRTRWPLKPRIFDWSSTRNPFITDITMIKVATPSMMPRNEKPAITEMKPSLRRARR
jgi:hypothetical protein